MRTKNQSKPQSKARGHLGTEFVNAEKLSVVQYLEGTRAIIQDLISDIDETIKNNNLSVEDGLDYEPLDERKAVLEFLLQIESNGKTHKLIDLLHYHFNEKVVKRRQSRELLKSVVQLYTAGDEYAALSKMLSGTEDKLPF